MEINDKIYLTPPDNDALPVLKCSFCGEDIYEGDEYYMLNGFYCCCECLDSHFKYIAALPDYQAEKADLEHDEQVTLPDDSHTKL